MDLKTITSDTVMKSLVKTMEKKGYTSLCDLIDKDETSKIIATNLLFIASYEERFDIILLLLDNGIYEPVALREAIAKGRVDVIQSLLKRGIVINNSDILFAKNSGYDNIADLLQKVVRKDMNFE